MKIACAGVHVLDTHVVGIESIPSGSEGQLVETIRQSAAGTAGGTALVLARLGAEVSCLGAVGRDPIGDQLLSLLGAEGVDVSGLVRKDAQPTSASVIPLRPDGQRPAWHCIGANGAFTLDDLADDALHGIDHLHLGGPEFLGGDAAAELLSRARDAGATTSVDVLAPGDPDLLAWIEAALPHVDHLLPNDEQVLGFTGADDLADGARRLLDAGVGCVAATAGSQGAVVVTAEETRTVQAYEIDVVDTTGCGDAFSAGYLRGLGLGLTPGDAAVLGCATAAHVAGGLGTDHGDYDLARVQEFAERHPTR